MFEKRMIAGWGDMDFNSHMGNTAFLDKAADVRMMFFAEHGFPTSEFVRRHIGPVVRSDALDYFAEIRMLDELRVTLAIAGLAPDGSRFIVRNEFWRGERLAARVTSTGGWLDLTTRKLTVPPDELLAALRSLHRTEDYRELPSSIRIANAQVG